MIIIGNQFAEGMNDPSRGSCLKRLYIAYHCWDFCNFKEESINNFCLATETAIKTR